MRFAHPPYHFVVLALSVLVAGVVNAKAVDADKDDSKTPPPPPPQKEARPECRWVQDLNIPKSVTAMLKSSQGPGSDSQVIANVTLMCQLTDASEVNDADVKFTLQSPDSCGEGLCVLNKTVPNKFTIRKNKWANTGVKIYVANQGDTQTRVLRLNDLKFKLTLVDDEDTVDLLPGPATTGLSGGIALSVPKSPTTCQVMVSGANDGIPYGAQCNGSGCTPADAVSVQNGGLAFRVLLDNPGGTAAAAAGKTTSASTSSYPKITWTGPAANGVWKTPPLTAAVARAQVTMADKSKVFCALKFLQQAPGYRIKVDRYGDCPLFRAIRNYYFLNPDETAAQSYGYPTPLTIAGFQARYGTNAPDVPFRGVMNAASDKAGVITVQEGQVFWPQPDQRNFAAAVIIARTMNPKTMAIGDIKYWGTLNPQDYADVSLMPVASNTPDPDDDDLFVFQTFAASSEFNPTTGLETRGQGGTPLHKFVDSKNMKPADYLIPVMNTSCMPVFQIRAPLRNDKPDVPLEMRDMVSCAFTKPFTFGTFKTGRVRLSVLHLTPQLSNHEFPLDLIKATPPPPPSISTASTSSSSAATPAATGPKACWKINPSVLGSPSWESGSGGGGGTTTTVIKERRPGEECSVDVSSKSTTSGGGRLGFRWNQNAMAWGYSFAKRVRDAADPKLGTVDYLIDGGPAAQQYGVADVKSWMDALPSSIFNGSTSEAPAGEVKTQNFFVRLWGYDNADLNESGVTAFKAPICPGSQFKYDNVSLSWSPLILDIKGRGIHISRRADRAVPFDMSGRGVINIVDWPENPTDVAFLVRPNAGGEVTSIDQLFGDNKDSNGFAKLAKLDSNHDAKISAADAEFGRLRLWFDRNRNGRAEGEELENLDDHGVASINLSYSRAGRTPSAENKVLSGVYYNSIRRAYANIEDQYFYEYADGARK